MYVSTFFRQEDVERCKNKDLLEALLKEMAGEFPQLTKILVDERGMFEKIRVTANENITFDLKTITTIYT